MMKDSHDGCQADTIFDQQPPQDGGCNTDRGDSSSDDVISDRGSPLDLTDSAKSAKEKKTYKCHKCRYTTDRKNNLKRHIATMHDKCPKVLECCEVAFVNKASLRDHVLSCHKFGYDCRICGRNFCRKALLKRHVAVHSGQKDFICQICGYATSHKSNLDRHKRRHGQTFVSPLGSGSIQPFLPSINLLSIPKLVPKLRLKQNFYVHAKSSVKSFRVRNRYGLPQRLTVTHQKNNTYEQTGKIPPFRNWPQSTQIKTRMDYLCTKGRLAPWIHRCTICTDAFCNQLDLNNHVSTQHTWGDNPGIPLTIQARHSNGSFDQITHQQFYKENCSIH